MKGPGENCPTPQACAENAFCDRVLGTCQCGAQFVRIGDACQEAIPAKRPCTALGQCVANAECTTAQGGLCDCAEGFYAENGACKTRIPEGDPCRKTSQCVARSECSPMTGRCQCEEGFFALDGACHEKVCVCVCRTPRIAFRHLPPNSARFSDANEGALFISAQLSSVAVSALRKVRVLI